MFMSFSSNSKRPIPQLPKQVYIASPQPPKEANILVSETSRQGRVPQGEHPPGSTSGRGNPSLLIIKDGNQSQCFEVPSHEYGTPPWLQEWLVKNFGDQSVTFEIPNDDTNIPPWLRQWMDKNVGDRK